MGNAVSRCAAAGGGWLTWIFFVDDVSKVEVHLKRYAVEGYLTQSDGHHLSWQQIGVLGKLKDEKFSIFIEWKSLVHPCTDGKAIGNFLKVEIAGDKGRITDWFGNDLLTVLVSEVEVIGLLPADTEG